MSWISVARKDFQDSIRSRTLLVVIVAFVLLLGLMTYAITWIEPAELTGGMQAEAYTGMVLLLLSGNFPFIPSPVPALLPLIGLLLGYKSIVGERETGQLKFLLGLPNSRLDVVVGKVAGRSLAGTVAALAGLFVSLLLLGISGSGTLAFGPFLWFSVVTIVFVLAHVSIGVGISAAVPTSGWATGLLLLFVGIFEFAWGAAFTIAELQAFDGDAPNWFQFVRSMSPGSAYESTLNYLVFQPLEDSIAEAANTGELTSQSAEVFYLADWFGILILLFWTVVPLTIGYVVFSRSDLG